MYVNTDMGEGLPHIKLFIAQDIYTNRTMLVVINTQLQNRREERGWEGEKRKTDLIVRQNNIIPVT